MGYSQIPTRSTTDTNTSADINQIQDNIDVLIDGTGASAPTYNLDDVETKVIDNTFSGGSLAAGTAGNRVVDHDSVSNDGTLAANSDNYISTQKAIKTYVDGAASTKPDFVIDIPAGGAEQGETNYPEYKKKTLTNGVIWAFWYDDTTEEEIVFQARLPSDIDTSATVTIEAVGTPNTWVTGKNVALKLYHSAKNDDEDVDAAYSSKASGDLALNTDAQDYIDILSFTETVANLGWAANDFVRFKFSRTAAGSNNLSGDWLMTHLRIIVPRT